jgi:hypothetical protein
MPHTHHWTHIPVSGLCTDVDAEATNISRRRFLTAAGASAVTLAVLPTGLAAETAAAPKINLGLTMTSCVGFMA